MRTVVGFGRCCQRLGADIRQIERQNNEMQLQTVNQKRLHTSLESLLVRPDCQR